MAFSSAAFTAPLGQSILRNHRATSLFTASSVDSLAHRRCRHLATTHTSSFPLNLIAAQQQSSSASSSSSSQSPSVPQDVNADPLPRFRRDEDAPQASFFDNSTTSPSSTSPAALSPNERVLLQVRATMQQLGVSPEDESKSTPPVPTNLRSIQDLSRGNPLSAFVGSVGASIMSYFAWRMLQSTVELAALHPMDDRIYIVQRVTTIVRTALVSLFALGSGISGVTALGLLLLSFRLSFAMLTGEFNKEEENKSN